MGGRPGGSCPSFRFGRVDRGRCVRGGWRPRCVAPSGHARHPPARRRHRRSPRRDLGRNDCARRRQGRARRTARRQPSTRSRGAQQREPVAGPSGIPSLDAAASAVRALLAPQGLAGVEATRDAGRASTPQRSTRKPTTTVRPDSGDGSVEAESLEQLLAEIPAGLTANAVAQRAGAGYSRTLRLLHELEAAGQVRRPGARRSTVW